MIKKELKIYTKTGDKGETDLIGGKRVPKYHKLIEAYGTVDELNSYIGLIRDLIEIDSIKNSLLAIEEQLFIVESMLATYHKSDINKSLPLITENNISFLETEIDNMNKSLPTLTSFILPGGHPTSSYCHVARCVCRRAERVTLYASTEFPIDDFVLKYLNRLSDYLFVLARFISKENNAEEILWKH